MSQRATTSRLVVILAALRRLAVPTLCIVFFADCSSPPKNQKLVSKLWPHLLKVRRPLTASADPKASPGGSDFRSATLPNEKLDCEAVDAILPKDANWAALRACFESMESAKPTELSLVLVRKSAPLLSLEDPDDAPECLRKLLPEIPVPREVFFRARDRSLTGEGAPLCYSSRLNVEADRKFGAKLPMAKLAVKVQIPLKPMPKSDDQMKRTVSAWALTPLFRDIPGGSTGSLGSQVVPERMCMQCLGPTRPDDDVPLWP